MIGIAELERLALAAIEGEQGQHLVHPSARTGEQGYPGGDAVESIGQAVAAERKRCAKLCMDYSADKIRTGHGGDVDEWMAHGAEACGQLILGNNEYGDKPGSKFFEDPASPSEG